MHTRGRHCALIGYTFPGKLRIKLRITQNY